MFNRWHLVEGFFQVMFIVRNTGGLSFTNDSYLPFQLIFILYIRLSCGEFLFFFCRAVWSSLSEIYGQSLDDFNSQLSKLFKVQTMSQPSNVLKEVNSS